MILLGMGILACVVLSLLMQRGLKLQMNARSDPVVTAVTEVFGTQLQAPPQFQIRAEGPRRSGLLQLTPVLASSGERLASDVGRLVWQQAPGRFDELVILVKRDVEDEGTAIPIPRPPIAGSLQGVRRVKLPSKAPDTRVLRPATRPGPGR